MKINVITAPDYVYTEGVNMLLVHPSDELLKTLQDNVLSQSEADVNIYIQNDQDNIEWMLNTYKIADVCIIDVDNVVPAIRDAIGYFLANTKTYWLTNGENIVYNNINKNRIMNIEDITNIGGLFVKTT